MTGDNCREHVKKGTNPEPIWQKYIAIACIGSGAERPNIQDQNETNWRISQDDPAAGFHSSVGRGDVSTLFDTAKAA